MGTVTDVIHGFQQPRTQAYFTDVNTSVKGAWIRGVGRPCLIENEAGKRLASVPDVRRASLSCACGVQRKGLNSFLLVKIVVKNVDMSSYGSGSYYSSMRGSYDDRRYDERSESRSRFSDSYRDSDLGARRQSRFSPVSFYFNVLNAFSLIDRKSVV